MSDFKPRTELTSIVSIVSRYSFNFGSFSTYFFDMSPISCCFSTVDEQDHRIIAFQDIIDSFRGEGKTEFSIPYIALFINNVLMSLYSPLCRSKIIRKTQGYRFHIPISFMFCEMVSMRSLDSA